MIISAAARAMLEGFRNEPRRLFVPFALPGRRELDQWIKERTYEENKAGVQRAIVGYARRAGAAWRPPAGKVILACVWFEETRHRDPGNIFAGGHKLLDDALARGRDGRRGWEGAGLLHCDGQHCIAGNFDVVVLAQNGYPPGVQVTIAPVQLELSARARRVEMDLRETQYVAP